MTQAHQPSPLQRRIVIVLGALDEKRLELVLTQDIEGCWSETGNLRYASQTCTPPGRYCSATVSAYLTS